MHFTKPTPILSEHVQRYLGGISFVWEDLGEHFVQLVGR